MMLAVAANAFAEEIEIDGLWFEVIPYIDQAKVIKYKNDVKYSGSIVIPKTVKYEGLPYDVTGIGKRAFYECSGLTSITIPESVTTIEDFAFYKCINLSSVIIPNSVTTMNTGVFANCSGLTSVTISNSITRIENYTFQSCSSLTSVTIPNSVTSLGISAFNDCRSLTSLTIPNKVTSIGEQAFEGSGLTSITIPNSVVSINSRAFANCKDLISVTIPNSVTSLGDHAFYGCKGLTSISISNSLTNIEDWTFYLCDALKTVTIPSSVTNIGNNAFASCNALISISIPNSVTSIGEHAFSNCISLTSVTIPNSVTSIGSKALYNCFYLNTLFIGKGVKTIGEYAFSYCSRLTDVYCYAGSVPSTNTNAFESSNLAYATLHVPAGSVNSYKSAPWNGFCSISPLKNSSPNMNPQVFQIDADSHNITDERTTIVKDYVWGSIDGTIDIINAFDDDFTKFDASCDGYNKVIIDGNEILANEGIRGSFNPKDSQGNPPTKSLNEPAGGTVLKINAKKDGWVYIITKLDTNKPYIVFENNNPIGYKIAMEVLGSNDEQSEATAKYVPSGILKLNLHTDGRKQFEYLINEYTGDSNVVLKASGLGVFYFPVKKGCSYQAMKCQARINWSGIYFSDAEACSISVSNDNTVFPLFPLSQKCATPTINYENGKISFSCDTGGVRFISEVAYDSNRFYEEEISLSNKFKVTVYAAKLGYENSESVTKVIQGEDSGIKGDVDGNGVVNVADHVELSKIIMNQNK